MRILLLLFLALASASLLFGCSGIGVSVKAAAKACIDPTAVTEAITEPLCTEASLGGGQLVEEPAP